MPNEYNVQGILESARNQVLLSDGTVLDTAALLAAAESDAKKKNLPSDGLIKNIEIKPNGDIGYFAEGLAHYTKNEKGDYRLQLDPGITSGLGILGSAINVTQALFPVDVPKEIAVPMFKQRIKERENKIKQDIKESVEEFDPETSTATFVLKEGAWEGFLQNVSLLTGAELSDDPEEKVYQIQKVATELNLPLEKTKQYIQKLEDTNFARKATAAVTNSILIMAELIGTRGKLGGKQLTQQGVKFLTKEGLKHYGKEIARQGAHSWKLMGVGANIRAEREAMDEMIQRGKKGEDLDIWDWFGTFAKHYATENIEAAMEGASEGLIKDLRMGSVGIKRLLAGSGDAWRELGKNLGKHGLASIFFETATEQVTDVTSDILRGTSSSLFNIDFIKLIKGEQLDKESEYALENLLIEIIVGGVLGGTVGMHHTLTRKREEELKKHFPKVYEKVIANDRAMLKKAEEEAKEKLKKKTKDEEESVPEVNQVKEDIKTKVQMSRDDIDSHLENIESDLHQLGLSNVDIAKQSEIQRISEDTERTPDSPILSDMLYIGDINLKNYFKAYEEGGTKVGAVERDVLSKATRKEVDKYMSITSEAFRNIDASLGLSKELGINDPIITPEFRNDMLTGVLLGVDITTLLQNKYGGLYEPEMIGDLFKKVYNSQSDLVKGARGRAAKVFDQNMELLAKEILAKGKQPESDLTYNNEDIAARETFSGTQINSMLDDPNFMGEFGMPEQTKTYEVSSRGDKRFSAFYAKLKNGRSIEEIYQTDIKGYSTIKEGKGKPPLNQMSVEEGYKAYKNLWLQWAQENPELIKDLRVKSEGRVLTDMFARTKTNQARALAEILLETNIGKLEQKETPKQEKVYTVGNVLKSGTVITLKEFFPRIRKTEKLASQNKEFEALEEMLTELVPNVQIRLEKDLHLADGTKVIAKYNEITNDIAIDPNSPLIDQFGVPDLTILHKAILHEGVHALTVNWMDNTPEGQLFTSKIQAIIKDVEFTLDNPTVKLGKGTIKRTTLTPENIRGLKQGPRWKDIKYHLESPKEFVAGIISDTTTLRGLLGHITLGGPESQEQSAWKTILNWIVEGLKDLYKKLKGKDSPHDFSRTALETTLMTFDTYKNDIRQYFNSNEGAADKALKDSNFENQERLEEIEQHIVDELDNDEQEDTEAYSLDRVILGSFIDTVAELKGMSTTDYYDAVKQMTYSGMMADYEELNAKHKGLLDEKLRLLHDSFYKRYVKDFKKFKQLFLTQKRNRALQTSLKKFVSLRIEPDPMASGQPIVKAVLLPHNFRGPDGKRLNTYREDTVIEDFVPHLIDKLGLSHGDAITPADIEVVYLNDVSTVKGGNVVDSHNVDRLNLYSLDESMGTISQTLARRLRGVENEGYTYLYIGNFAGKNTMPLLSIKSSLLTAKGAGNITAQIEAMAQHYKQAIDTSKVYNPNYGFSTGATLRLFLEDMWESKGQVAIEQNQLVNSVILPQLESGEYDFNAIQKRGTKWVYSKTVAEQSKEYLISGYSFTAGKELFEVKGMVPHLKKMSGISHVDNKVKVRTAVFSSVSDNIIEVTAPDGEVISINIQDILMNNGEIETTDGASFYIIGELDEVYVAMHGALKKGALKNVYGSTVGEDQLFIKHAMHGTSYKSRLGQWMKKHNIGLLVSDSSAKINKKFDEQGQLFTPQTDLFADEIEPHNIYNLDLDRFARIKEEQNTSKFGGRLKQFLNGSGFSEIYNTAIVKAAKGKLSVSEAISELMDNTVDLMREEFKNLDETALFELLKGIASVPTSPKELVASKAFGRLLTKEFDKYAPLIKGWLNHPLPAEILRSDIKNKVSDVIEMKIPGWRATIRPDVGYVEEAAINAVTNQYNARFLILNDNKAFADLIPNKKTRDLIRKYDILRREITRSLSKKDKDRTDKLEAKVVKLKEEIAAIGADESPFEKDRIAEDLKKDPMRLIQVNSAKAKQHLGRIYNDIFDKQTGRLKNRYVVISREDARRFGVKAGDKLIAVVTPTDSTLSVSSVIVAGIAPNGRTVDNNTIMMNSDYIQTKVGKDFDIDTISLMPYDPDVWTAASFESLTSALEKVEQNYEKEMIKVMKRVYKEGGLDQSIIDTVNSETVHKQEYKQLYNQVILGPTEGQDKFSPLGADFWIINDAYTNDPSTIITQRLQHNILSAIDFKTEELKSLPYHVKNGQPSSKKFTIPSLQVRNEDWFKIHSLFINLTTDFIDFPNNTTKLTYNSNPYDPVYKQKMFKTMFSLNDDVKVPVEFIDAFINVYQTMFQGALDLTKMIDSRYREQAYGQLHTRKKLALPDLIDALNQQKRIFDAIESGDFAPIYELFEKAVHLRADVKREKGTFDSTNLDNKTDLQLWYGREILSSMKSMNLEAYPLFRLIKQMNLSDIQAKIPGNDYINHLYDDINAVKMILATFPNLKEMFKLDIIDEASGAKSRSFRYQDKQGEYTQRFPRFDVTQKLTLQVQEQAYIDDLSIAYSMIPRAVDYHHGRKFKSGEKYSEDQLDQKLEIFQREVLGIVNALDQNPVSSESGADSTTEYEKNNIARARSFPRLFNLMLDNKRLSFNPVKWNGELILENGKYPIKISYLGSGLLGIEYKDKAYLHTILKTEGLKTETGRELISLLTTKNGIWQSTQNRIDFSRVLSFQENTEPDARGRLVDEMLAARLYSPNSTFYGRESQVAFWLSTLAGTTNTGLAENKNKNLTIANTPWSPSRPHKYRYNTLSLELLAKYEPELLEAYIMSYSYSNQKKGRIDPVHAQKVLKQHSVLSADNTSYGMPQFTEDPAGSVFHTFQTLFEDYIPGQRIKNYKKFTETIKNKGTGAALAELKKLTKQTGTLRALAELGFPIEEFVKDVTHMNASQFMKKYSILGESLPGELIKYYDQRAEDYVQDYIDDNAGVRTIKAAFWVLSEAVEQERKLLKEPGKIKKFALGFLNYDTYHLKKEKKTYALTSDIESIGIAFPETGIHPNDIFVPDVQRAQKLYVSKQKPLIGDSSLSHYQAQKLNRALKRRQVEDSRKIDSLNKIVGILSNLDERQTFLNTYSGKLSNLSPGIKYLYNVIKEMGSKQYDAGLMNENIWDIAEDFALKTEIKNKAGNKISNLRVFIDRSLIDDSGNIDKAIKYSFVEEGNTEATEKDSLVELMEDQFGHLSPVDKLKLIGAYALRELYDVRAISHLYTTRAYIAKILTDQIEPDMKTGRMSADILTQMKALYLRYDMYIRVAHDRQGNYMPHQYSNKDKKSFFNKGFRRQIELQVLNLIKKEKELKDAGSKHYDPIIADLDLKSEEGKDMVERMVNMRVENNFLRHQSGLPGSYMMPNFLTRGMEEPDERYSKNPDVHHNYISNLFATIKNDIMYVDWLTYQHKAVKAGESPQMIHMMRDWYADQIQNKLLHGHLMRADDLKPGMQIAFMDADPASRGTEPFGIVVSGTVKSASNGELVLDMDEIDLRSQVFKDIARREKQINYQVHIAGNAQGLGLESVSENQIAAYRKLSRRGYAPQRTIEELTQLSSLELNEEIIRALKKVLKDPSKMATYNIADIYQRDITHEAKSGYVMRMMRKGAAERLAGKARELNNMMNIEGEHRSAMTQIQWALAKGGAKTLDFLSDFKRKTLGLLFMGLAAAPKAYITNMVGANISNYIDAPYHNYKIMKQAKGVLNSLKVGDRDAMGQDEQRMFDIMTSLGLAGEDNLLAISLEAGNIRPDEVIQSKRWRELVPWAIQTWVDGSGYGAYTKELSELRRDWVRAYGNESERIDIENKIKRLKKIWYLKSQDYIKESRDLTDEQVDQIIEKHYKKEVVTGTDIFGKEITREKEITPDKQKVNLAEDENLTRAALFRVVQRSVRKKLYVSNIGIGLQAKAEKKRQQAFLIGYYTAIEQGLSETEAIQYGVNSVEMRHAFYDPAFKQVNANTKLGRALMQYSQYSFNAFGKHLRLMKAMIPQLIEHYPRGKGTWKLRVVDSKFDRGGNLAKFFPKKFSIPKLDFLLDQSIKAWDEEAQRWKTKEEIGIGEVNILAALMHKYMMGFMMMQAGSRLFYGLTNFQDPMIQLGYQFFEMIAQLIAGGYDDDDETRASLLWLATDAMFMVGVPYKLFLQFLGSEEKDIKSVYYKGRIRQQDEFFARLSNTIENAHELYFGNEVGKTGKYKGLIETDYIIDNFVLGMKVAGWTGAQGHRAVYQGESFLFGKELIELPPAQRPIETYGKGITAERRAIEAINPKTWIPYLDILTEQ